MVKLFYKPKSSFHSHTYSHEEKNILMNDEEKISSFKEPFKKLKDLKHENFWLEK